MNADCCGKEITLKAVEFATPILNKKKLKGKRERKEGHVLTK
jgi:hypothetical protein